MELQDKIILELYSKEYMDSISLSSVAEGRFWLNRTTVNGQQKFLEIVSRNNTWWFLIPKTMKVKGETSKCFRIKGNHIYEITDNTKQVLLLISRIYEKENYEFQIVHTNDDNITIGRSSENEIQYDCPLISLHHAILERHTLRWCICDMNSTNGIYVNKTRIEKMYLNIGDVIDLYGLKIIITAIGLLVNMMKHTYLHIKQSSEIRTEAVIRYEKIHMQVMHIAPYRCIPFTTNILEVEGPPKAVIKDELPLIYLLGPSVTMGLSSISMAVYSLYNAILNKQNITQVIPTLLMAVSMSLGTILWPVLSKRYERIQKIKLEEHRIKKYSSYLQCIQKDIEGILVHQYTLLCNTYPVNHAIKDFHTMDLLWSRKYCHESFLVCILGIGNIKADLSFTYPKENFQLHEDELYMKLQNMVNQNYQLLQVPILLHLKDKHQIGIYGDKHICEQLLIHILYQIAYYHSYQDVKIICLADPLLLRKYHIPYLPHLFSADKSIRYMIHDKKDEKRIRQHFEERKSMEGSIDKPYFVIFCFLSDCRIFSCLTESLGHMKQAIVLCYARQRIELPAACEELLQIDDSNQLLHFENGQLARLKLRTEIEIANDFLHLANMQVSEEEKVNFPDELSFLDLFECGNIQQLHILKRWEKADVVHSLETAIGVHESGEVLLLDAHENYHGPHGLLAGMTGSGKSETILTYILSLAINYSPNDVSFLLIDYKGGSMAKAFEILPHVAGIITNLDQGSMQRCLAAIQSEVTRRQRVFANISKIYDKSNIDIDKYRSLCQEHKEIQLISHLFIIADEFAELKSLQPQFLDSLKQSARIGRSLGIHLLLATQKPSGVVDDQIWSNSRFHICLRVQDRSDSQDMLKREDAAFIRRTGLFYFQVGNNEEYKKGLSAWSQAPYEPKEYYEQHKNNEITIIDHTGQIIRSRASKHKDTKIKETQLDAIVSYIAELSCIQHIRSDRIWKEELPEKLLIREVKQQYGKHIGLVGCVDDVNHQAQFPMCITLKDIGHMVVYGQAHSGKQRFIETLLTSWCIDYDTSALSIIVLNFENTKFKIFQTSDIIVDVLFTDDKEKVESMFIQLLIEIKKRKHTLSTKSQSILIIIYNFEHFHELYEAYDSDLQYILREGEKYRVFVLLTLNNVNSIPYKFSQYIQKIIMFQVKEQNDYRLCYENYNGLCPVHKEGSGIFENKEIYLFQTAYYENSEIVSAVERKQGKNTFCIPILPERVMHEILHNGDKAFIGLDVQSKEEVYLNLQYQFIYMLGDHTLFWNYLNLLIRQLDERKETIVLKGINQISDKEITGALNERKQNGKKIIIIWYQLQDIYTGISSGLFSYTIRDKEITHIIIDTMHEINTYTMFEWFVSSLIDACILWMGNGFIDHQYALKRAANHLQNRLQKNRAYLLEEDQCKELQLWEVEKNG